MSKTGGIVELTVFLAVVIILIALFYLSREKKRKREIKEKFRKFTESYRLSHQDMRTVPRITVPDAMEITLKLTDDKYLGLKAHVIDMSLSGFAVKPDFPLKRLPLNTLLENVLVVTPINTFVVREMRTVRIDHQVDKRLMAFHIEKIDGDQFEYLKTFIAYLDNFLKKNEEEETV